MKILVTGAAGFLGSHLCKRLCANPSNSVIGLDNLITGHLSNLKELQSLDNFNFIQHDINDALFIPVDQIYNLACPASPVQYQKHPVFTINTCVVGMKNVLDLAQKNNARLLQASTSEIYGDPFQHPQTENYWGNVNCYGPRSCYDEGKRCAESLCWSYTQENRVDVRIARIFNTYGPNMDVGDGRVVSNFITQSLSSKDITVHGDGEVTRSFCYVDDNIRGLITLMNSNVVDPVNIGNPTETTLNELANLVQQIVNTESKVIHLDLEIDVPIKRCPDISRAKKLLNWEPQIDLYTGIQSTADYFKNILKR